MRGGPLFCTRLWKNYWKNAKNSALTLRGRVCLSKSALFLLLEMLCNGRDKQVPSQPTRLCFMVQLQKIIGHAHKIPFYHDIGISPGQKTPEVHVLFNHGKYALCLDGTVDTEQDSFLCGNLLLHCFPRIPQRKFPRNPPAASPSDSADPPPRRVNDPCGTGRWCYDLGQGGLPEGTWNWHSPGRHARFPVSWKFHGSSRTGQS